MSNVEIYDSYAKKFNFSLHSTGNTNRMYINHSNGICLTVITSSNEFKLTYNISHTIFSIDSGILSPFYEAEPKYNQFEKMYKRFVNVVNSVKRKEGSF